MLESRKITPRALQTAKNRDGKDDNCERADTAS
jgi:hypothetical protein